MNIVLELFICANEAQGAIRYHRLCRDITAIPADPDDILLETLERLGGDARLKGAVAHSTSWRYEKGRTLLTYMVWGSADTLAGLQTRVLSVDEIVTPSAAGPLAPRPKTVDETHVLAHGLGHLRYLVCERREPFLSGAMVATGALDMIHRIAPTLSGRLG
jgi:hypothetical protein